MVARALIVDDEPDLLNLLAMTLTRMQIDCTQAQSLVRARQLLSEQAFDLCLTDMRLPDGNGIELVRFAAATRPRLPVAVITAYGSLEAAVEAMKAGAFDFIAKPLKLPHLRAVVASALELGHQAVETAAPLPNGEAALLGSSPAITEVRQLIDKLARSQAPVCITGESGTGKELAARLIHRNGPRATRAFVPVNCGAIPAELLESELFGHRRGSFTGAIRDKQGLFQLAEGGTLFLDEIAELSLPHQVKLLRAIQEKAVRPIGSAEEVEVDVRVISATHRDLRRLVAEGRFREDLFYRIDVIELTMPPLREHPEDVATIAQHRLAQIAGPAPSQPLRLDPDALAALSAYPFPGNVRELENILQRAATLCEGAIIRRTDLQLPGNTRGTPHSASTEAPLGGRLEQIERQAILDTLAETHWNRTEAAKRLGMTLRALRYRLQKYELD